MKRKYKGGIYLIFGILMLIPAVVHLCKFVISRITKQSLIYLPDAHTDFILSIGGIAVDCFAVELIITIIGATLSLVGIRMITRTTTQ